MPNVQCTGPITRLPAFEISCFPTTFFAPRGFCFLIEYPFTLIFSKMDVYSNPMPMSSQKHVTHSYLDTEKMNFSFIDATFFTTNDFPFLIEYPFKCIFSMMDVYSDLKPMSSQNCVTHGYFSFFDATFFTTNNFRLLIEYPFKLILSMTIVFRQVNVFPVFRNCLKRPKLAKKGISNAASVSRFNLKRGFVWA